MNPDKIELIKDGVIQHGPYNDRVYLLKMIPSKDSSMLPRDLIELATTNKYSKIFVKVQKDVSVFFIDEGFEQEAIVPNLFYGKKDCLFLSYYLSEERRIEYDLQSIESIIELALARGAQTDSFDESNEFIIRKCNLNDIQVMVEIYSQVFTTYPFPIYDPSYIASTMKTNVEYYAAEVGSKIVALASAEFDNESSSVEMTDFATVPGWRGNNLASYLLYYMENEIKSKKINTAYTIARSLSVGMNITFAKLGYHYGGRLKNNTNISGKLESMNVWYKKLDG